MFYFIIHLFISLSFSVLHIEAVIALQKSYFF